MAAPNVRFTREWKARRGAPNVEFYYWDARQTPFEDGRFNLKTSSNIQDTSISFISHMFCMKCPQMLPVLS